MFEKIFSVSVSELFDLTEYQRWYWDITQYFEMNTIYDLSFIYYLFESFLLLLLTESFEFR